MVYRPKDRDPNGERTVEKVEEQKRSLEIAADDRKIYCRA
jgi:hypothetical protein